MEQLHLPETEKPLLISPSISITPLPSQFEQDARHIHNVAMTVLPVHLNRSIGSSPEGPQSADSMPEKVAKLTSPLL